MYFFFYNRVVRLNNVFMRGGLFKNKNDVILILDFFVGGMSIFIFLL